MPSYPIRTKKRVRASDADNWERIIAKYMIGAGIPGFRWDEVRKRFLGLKGLRFARYSTHVKGGWTLVQQEWRKYEGERKNPGESGELVMFITNKRAMPFVSDVFVLTKLDTFADLLVAAANADPERFYRKDE